MTAEYFAPEFRVELEGASLAADVTKNITDVSVTLVPDAIDSLRLTLANPYPALRWTHTKDRELFVEGTPIKVWMGYAGAPLVLMFDGELTGMTPSFPEGGSPTLELEGFSRLQRLQRNSELITLQGATDGDMVRRIAQASGLTARVEDPGIRYPQLTTARQAHLKYLLDRAKALGRTVWVEGTTLHFAAPRATGGPAYTLVWGRTRESFTAGSLPLQSFSPSLDTRRQVSAVVVRGQDPLTREVFEGRASATPALPGGAAAVPEGAPELVVVDEPVTSPAEAQVRARALYDDRANEFIQGSGTTLGIPGLRPGTMVMLDGLGRFNGKYYVTRATHSIGGGGYRTSFGVQKNSVGAVPDSVLAAVTPPPDDDRRVYGVVTGVVTNNQDPEKLGRVKLRFPWFSSKDESGWAPVAAPMAGNERGMWMLPAVDDEVLVAFDRGDMLHPYVVGSLWSQAAKPPKAGVEAGSQVTVLHSRSGHVVRLDDRKGEERIEITDRSGKNSIVISTKDNGITLTSQGDLTLESTGGSVVLKANKRMHIEAEGAVKVLGKRIDLN